VELIIVVAILGILAAIVLPEFQGHVQQAKEAAAKGNLRMLREAIERYAADHNGVPPGYNLNDTSNISNSYTILLQLVMKVSNSKGELAAIGTEGYPYGPYLFEIPQNPFNRQSGLSLISNGGTFPIEPSGVGGWYYKPQDKEIRLNWTGTDSEGVPYYNY